jgi:hypothetical protein
MPYNINGLSINLPDPVNAEGTTFVPSAGVTQGLGGTIEWKHDAKTARIEIGGRVAFVYLDNPVASVDGAALDMQAKPYLENDALWVPARLFRDAFGASLDVDGSNVTLSA